MKTTIASLVGFAGMSIVTLLGCSGATAESAGDIGASADALTTTGSYSGFVATAPAAFPNGVGAPSVVYNSTSGTYTLYAEGPLSSTYAVSGRSSYGIARFVGSSATSFVADSVPVLYARSTNANWYDVSIAQPSVVVDAATGNYYMFFTSTGTVSRAIGMATSTDGVTWTVGAAPVVSVSSTATALGDPSAVIVSNKIILTYTSGKNIYKATYDIATSTWSFASSAVFSPSGAASQAGGLNGSSNSCDETTGQVQTFLYGFNSAGTAKEFTSYTNWSTTADAAATYKTSTGANPTWNHWDVLPTSGGLFIYTSTKTGSNFALGFSYTGSLTATPSSDRNCL